MTEELVTFETAKLARVKGFDEECRDVWVTSGGKVRPGKDIFARNAPVPKKVRDIYEEVLNTDPTKNSHLQEHIYARPTQDLLERWLRETHNLYLLVGEFIIGDNWKSGYIFYGVKRINCAEQQAAATVQSTHASYELAREAAIFHALNLLP